MTPIAEGWCRLSHLGVIEAAGPDAAAFLHGQLTQDCLGMTAAQARLAGYCSAKGRLLASFMLLRPQPERFLLVCSADVLAPTCKRLQMFVLRAKLSLRDASADLPLWGWAGGDAGTAGLPGGAYEVAQGPDSLALRLPDVQGVVRGIRVADSAAAGTGATEASAELPISYWLWLEVRGGVARIDSTAVDRFVPQMLNHESVGAVNFKKGCYPGQEVVARSQFRGTLKRRAYVAHAAGELAAGQDIHVADATGDPCGVVVQAAPAPDGGSDAIACLQTAAEGAPLRLGSPQGEPLELLTLPYALLDDV